MIDLHRPLIFTTRGLCLLMVALPTAALDLNTAEFVDLSHPLNEETVFWPTQPSGFEKNTVAYGKTDGGFFYSAFSVCMPEHIGTHLDAPRHFSATGNTTDQIPLKNLIAPGILIDVSEQAAADRNYQLEIQDILAFEARHGLVQPGTAVLLRTGWSRFWLDRVAYLGDDTPGDASRLQFPSYGSEAARLLIENRRVAILGVDTASIDYGKSVDYKVHRIAAEANVIGLENLAGLKKLPPAGFTVIALPVNIEGGSGAPTRVVAVIPNGVEK